LAALPSCTRSPDDAHEQLADRRAEWTHALADLDDQQSALQREIERAARSQPKDDPAVAASAAQLRAVLAGTRQSLVQIKTQISESEPRISGELRKGGERANAAIAAEDRRFRNYIQLISAQLASSRERAAAEAKREEPHNNATAIGAQPKGRG